MNIERAKRIAHGSAERAIAQRDGRRLRSRYGTELDNGDYEYYSSYDIDEGQKRLDALKADMEVFKGFESAVGIGQPLDMPIYDGDREIYFSDYFKDWDNGADMSTAEGRRAALDSVNPSAEITALEKELGTARVIQSASLSDNADWQSGSVPTVASGKALGRERADKYLTDSESRRYHYLYNTQGSEAASSYMSGLSDTLKARRTAALHSFADEHPVLGSLASVGTGAVSAVEGTAKLFDYFVNAGLKETEAVNAARYTEALRGGAASDMGAVGQFFYNTAMSGVDSYLVSLIPGGVLLLGASAAASGMNDALERGADSEHAAVSGLATGIFEMLFESVSIGSIKKTRDYLEGLNPQELKNILGRLAASMGVNASEEMLTEIANITFDSIYMGDKSNAVRTVKAHIADGMSENEAKWQAAKELGWQVCEAGLSGGLMGGAFTGLNVAEYHVLNGAQSLRYYTKEGKEIKSLADAEETVRAYTEAARSFGAETEAYRLGEAYEKRGGNYRLGKMAGAVAREAARRAPAWEAQKSKIAEEALSDVTSTVQAVRQNAEQASRGGDITRVNMPKISDFGGFEPSLITVEGENGEKKTLTELGASDTELYEAYMYAALTGSVENANRFLELYRIYGNGISAASFWSAWIGAQNYGQTVSRDGALDAALERYSGYGVPREALTAAFLAGRGLRTSAALRAEAKQKSYEKAWREAEKNEYRSTAEEDKKAADAQAHRLSSASENGASQKTSNNKGNLKKRHIFSFDDSALKGKRLDASQEEYRTFLRVFSEVLGMNIKVFYSEKGKRGENGYFDRSTNTVFIDINAGIANAENYEAAKSGIINTLSHELVHNMALSSPTEYYALRDAVMNVLQGDKGYDVDRAIEAELEKYSDKGKKTDREAAIEEIVARACEDSLASSKAMKELLQELYAQDRSAANSFIRAVREFFARLERFFENIIKQKSVSAEAKRIAEAGEKTVAEIQDLFDSAVRAVRNGNIVRNGVKSVRIEDTVMYQSRDERGAPAEAVFIDTEKDIFDGVDIKDYGKTARAYMKYHFRGKQVGDAVFNKIGEGEYTHSEYTKKLYNKNTDIYKVKMQASTALDKIVSASRFIRHEDAKHKHYYNEKGYDRYEVLFSIGGESFSGELLIAVNGSDHRIFYDIVGIKRSTFNRVSDVATDGEGTSLNRGKTAVHTDSIPQYSKNVNKNLEKNIVTKSVDGVKRSTLNPVSDVATAGESTSLNRGKTAVHIDSIPQYSKNVNENLEKNILAKSDTIEKGIKRSTLNPVSDIATAGESTSLNRGKTAVHIDSIPQYSKNVNKNLEKNILTKSDNQEREEKHIDIYSEKDYNDYGWARANEILTAGENADYHSKFAAIMSKLATAPRTRDGEYMIAVSDIYSSAFRDIENTVVFAKGTIDKPIITRVLKVFDFEEKLDLEQIRRNLYAFNGRRIQQTLGELQRLYTAADCRPYGIYERDMQKESRYRVGLGADGGAGGGKASGSEVGGGKTKTGEEVKYREHEEWHTDIYSEKDYNDYGWVRANEILTVGENADYHSKFAAIKSKLATAPRTRDGEYMIVVNDLYGDIESTVVFAKGTIDKPIITRVLKVYAFAEEALDLEALRRNLYAFNGRRLQRTFGDFQRLYTRADCRSYGVYAGDILQKRADNYRLGADGGAGGGKTSGSEVGSGKTKTGEEVKYQERLSTPEASELLKKYFADGTDYKSYAQYVEGLKKYRKLAERAAVLENRISEADADIVRLRSERRQSGKGTRMNDIYRKRMTAEAQLAECKRRMLEMETRELRHVVESERARAVEEMRRAERNRYAEQRHERTQNAIKRQYIESIEGRVRDMHEMLSENSAKRHVPDALKKPVEELISAMDFSSRRSLAGGSTTKKEVSLNALVQSVRELSESRNAEGFPTLDLPPRFEAEWNRVTEEVYSLSTSVIGANGGKMTLENMSVDALRALNRALADIKHAVSVSDKIISGAREETVSKLAEASVAHMEALRRKKPSDGMLYSFLEWENTLPVYAFDRLGEAGRVLFAAFQDGWDTTVRDISRICEYTSSVYTPNEVRGWGREVHGFDCTALDGTERRLYLTVPQIMSLYCLLRRENGGALRHVTGGGVVSADIRADGKRYANDARGVRLSADKAAEIVSCLTERQRSVADSLQAFMSGECAEWGNGISIKRFGIRLFDENMYFPIRTKASSRDAELMRSTKSTAMYEILNMSFTKPLSERADGQIVIEDIFDVFASHTSAMARMHGLALPMLDYTKWYNYRRRLEAEGKQGFEELNVRDVLVNTFGKSGLAYFEGFAVSLSGAARTNDSAKIAVRLSKAAKVAMVGFNLRTAAQQPTAAVRALMYLGLGDMSLAALKPADVIRARELAVKYCPMAEWKAMGYFDVGTGRGIAELIRGTDTVKDKTVEASMWLAGKADEYTWAYLWVACERCVRRTEKGLRGGTEEFYAAVGKKLREVIYRTQVVDSPLTKSEYMKSSDGLKQATAMFMAEPTVTYNMMLEGKYRIDELKREGKGVRPVVGTVAKLCGICTLQAVLLAGVQSVFDAMRSGSDDEYGEKYLEAFFSNAISEANPFNKLPIFRDIFSALEGYTVERTDTTLWSRLSYVLKDIQKLLGGGTVTAYKAIYDMLSAFSSATGLPVSNLIREIVSLWNSTVGEEYPHLKIK